MCPSWCMDIFWNCPLRQMRWKQGMCKLTSCLLNCVLFRSLGNAVIKNWIVWHVVKSMKANMYQYQLKSLVTYQYINLLETLPDNENDPITALAWQFHTRIKCRPTKCGSLSIHIFMLLFRLIANSSVFPSDFARECKNTLEIGIPFDKMCDNFLLFIIQEWTIAF